MRHFLLLLTFSLSLISGVSAQQYVDSLRSRIANQRLDSEALVNDLLKLSVELVYVNPKESFTQVQRALEMASRLGYKKGIAECYRIIGSIYATEDNYISSADFIQRALAISEDLKDSVGIANCYISLGHTFRRQGNRQKELYYHRLSYQFFSRNKIVERTAVSAHNLGESFLNAGILDSALILTNQAIELNKQIKKTSVLSSSYNALGKIQLAKMNYNQAKKAFKTVLRLSEKLGSNSQKLALIESYFYLSQIAEIENDTALQLSYLQKALNINKSFNFSHYTKKIYEQLINYHIKHAMFAEVNRLFQESNRILDSLQTKQQIDRSELMQSAFKVYRLEEQTKLLNQTTALQQTIIKQQRFLIYLSVLLVVILLSALIYIQRINRQLKQSNKELEAQKNIIEQQKADLNELNYTKDKFFSIVAHDLRGPLCTLIQIAELYFSNEMEFTEKEKANIQMSFLNSLKVNYRLVENLISWAMVQMKKEKPTTTQVDLNLIINAISEMYEYVAKDKSIQILNHIPKNSFVYADENHVHLIMRNLIGNALKFSKNGSSIEISATTQENKVTIQVKDSGVGISPEIQKSLFSIEKQTTTKGTKGEKGSGLGLILVKEYTELNNGSIRFESTPGVGTSFYITLPKG